MLSLPRSVEAMKRRTAREIEMADRQRKAAGTGKGGKGKGKAVEEKSTVEHYEDAFLAPVDLEWEYGFVQSFLLSSTGTG
jgi:hypothetical protein